MPEMRTVNRVVLTGICAYVLIASCWLLLRSPASLPVKPSMSHTPDLFVQWEALQALKNLLKLIVIAKFIIRQGLYPFLGKPTDLQDAIRALDNL